MKKIVAVSGGVDSIVLLDYMIEKFGANDIIVAHFEHGIRGFESKQDLEFVKKIATEYGCKFEFSMGNLNKDASEALAREKRYDFLRKVSRKYKNAPIFTAHHKNDLAETFVMNLRRGGGWRSVAMMDSAGIERPFLKFSKNEIFEMAKIRNLSWREDSSNFELKYTRNKIRQNVKFSEQILEDFFEIWQKQVKIKHEIDKLVDEIIGVIWKDGKIRRDFFWCNSDEVCFEIVREIIFRQSGEIPLNRQVRDFLDKIRTFRSKSKTQILGGQNVTFSKEFFEFEKRLQK